MVTIHYANGNILFGTCELLPSIVCQHLQFRHMISRWDYGSRCISLIHCYRLMTRVSSQLGVGWWGGGNTSPQIDRMLMPNMSEHTRAEESIPHLDQSLTAHSLLLWPSDGSQSPFRLVTLVQQNSLGKYTCHGWLSLKNWVKSSWLATPNKTRRLTVLLTSRIDLMLL